jgi:hypothetical protein
MVKQETRITSLFIVLGVVFGMAASLSFSQFAEAKSFTRAQSLPKAEAEFNVYRLFQIQSGAVQFAYIPNQADRSPSDFSNEFLKRELQVRFKRAIQISNQQPHTLGASCSLRSMKGVDKSGNLLNSLLPLPTSIQIEEGAEYYVQNIVTEGPTLKAELAPQKSKPSRIELHCRHPQLSQWTVTSFEMHNQGAFELRTNIQRDPASLSHSYGPHLNSTLASLTGNRWNGFFGSGLPSTSGVQLLIGAQLSAFAENQNRALWVGNKCAVLNTNSKTDSGDYLKDSKFAFTRTEVQPSENKVRFHFENLSYEHASLTVECQGEASEVLAMSTADVENDLNQILHFYRK